MNTQAQEHIVTSDPTYRGVLHFLRTFPLVHVQQSNPESIAEGFIKLKHIEKLTGDAIKAVREMVDIELEDGTSLRYGNQWIDARDQTRTTYDVGAFIAAHPDLADLIKPFAKVTTSRVVSIRTVKEVSE
jgi:hypothetical protein